MTKVEKSVTVKVPISTVYNQWTQFEDFPQFMGGVTSVTQLGDDQLHWVAQIGGVKREWDAQVLEQVPDRKVAWAATSGATNAGHVTFEASGSDKTTVHLVLEYEPHGLVEKIGDKLGFVGNQAKTDLKKFKMFIEDKGYEDKGYATGAWRGSVNPGAGIGGPMVEHAAASRGDNDKAGVSATSVIGWVSLLAGAVAGLIAALQARKNKTQPTGRHSVQVDAAPAGTAVTTAAITPVQTSPVQTSPVQTSRVHLSAVPTSPAQTSPVDGGIDAPVTGAYEESTPHVLTDEDIEDRTPDPPQLHTDTSHHESGDGDADGSDSSSRR